MIPNTTASTSPPAYQLKRLSRRLLVALAIGGLTAYAAAAAQSHPAGASAEEAQTKLLVLGSGGPGATGRASSSYVLVTAGEPHVLIDAGPGSFARLGEAKVSLQSLDTILLTHLHIDHSAEIPGIVKARAVSASDPIHFNVFGPAGRTAQGSAPAFPSTSRFMRILFGSDGAFAYLKDFSAPVTFSVTDLPRPGSGKDPVVIWSQGDLKISAIAGHHGDAPAIIYRIDHLGKSIVFSGDVDPSGLPALERIARGADLLVFDQVVLDRPQSPAVLYSLHSPPSDIGALAARAQVKALLLSHLSPAVDEDRTAVTQSIARQFRGPVEFARDGLTLEP